MNELTGKVVEIITQLQEKQKEINQLTDRVRELEQQVNQAFDVIKERDLRIGELLEDARLWGKVKATSPYGDYLVARFMTENKELREKINKIENERKEFECQNKGLREIISQHEIFYPNQDILKKCLETKSQNAQLKSRNEDMKNMLETQINIKTHLLRVINDIKNQSNIMLNTYGENDQANLLNTYRKRKEKQEAWDEKMKRKADRRIFND